MNGTPVLDPDALQVSRHAAERWLERRGHRPPATGWSAAQMDEAASAIVAKLAELARKQHMPMRSPDLDGLGHRLVYSAGRLRFVLTGDLRHVVTLMVTKNEPRQAERPKPSSPLRRGGRPSADIDPEDLDAVPDHLRGRVR